MKSLYNTIIFMIAIQSWSLNGEVINEKAPAFTKIYVQPNEILTTYSGSFYISPEGVYEPVRCIRQDCDGTFVILITHYCPSCGIAYKGKVPLEGYSCPLYQKQSFPHIWCDH